MRKKCQIYKRLKITKNPPQVKNEIPLHLYTGKTQSIFKTPLTQASRQQFFKNQQNTQFINI